MKKALILVDIQNDFLPGGALAVPHGDEVIEVVNRLMQLKGLVFDLVIATQDWHPANHQSFAIQHPEKVPGDVIVLNGISQILWPVHCLQNHWGAELASKLNCSWIDRVFRKGSDFQIDSYSGFFDQGKLKSTGLSEYLKSEGVTEVTILGLATDYCVKYTAIDALSEGFMTQVIEDGVRAVNLQPEDGVRSLAEMRALGIEVIPSTQLLKNV